MLSPVLDSMSRLSWIHTYFRFLNEIWILNMNYQIEIDFLLTFQLFEYLPTCEATSEIA